MITKKKLLETIKDPKETNRQVMSERIEKGIEDKLRDKRLLLGYFS